MNNNGHPLKPEGFRLNTRRYLLLMRAVEQSPALEIFNSGLNKVLSSLTSELALL